MKFNYFPGCSLERNAHAYHDSALTVASALNIEFVEVDDWNCCGATEKIAVEKLEAYALAARNLAITSRQRENGELIAPCSLCFLNLRKGDKHMAESPELAREVNAALAAGGLSYEPGSVKAKHLLDVFTKYVEPEEIQSQVVKPLYGLRIAPYYGCLITRPGYNGGTDYDFPTSLDELMKLLGAEVIDFSLKTHCCGGHMTQISEPTALELIRRLLKNAENYEADVIVTLCPMCQFNLDAYQDSVNKYFGTKFNIPILYFTQLMGVAFGIKSEELGIGVEFVSASKALSRISDRPPAKSKKIRLSKEALPMPGLTKET